MPKPIIIKLSGAYVIGLENVPDDTVVEVRQYHRDFQVGDRDVDVDGDGAYEVVEVAS